MIHNLKFKDKYYEYRKKKTSIVEKIRLYQLCLNINFVILS